MYVPGEQAVAHFSNNINMSITTRRPSDIKFERKMICGGEVEGGKIDAIEVGGRCLPFDSSPVSLLLFRVVIPTPALHRLS